MSDYEFIDELDYDEDMSVDSFFPEWIESDRLQFKRLTEESMSPQELKQVREDNPSFSKYFPSDSVAAYGSGYGDVLRWYEIADELWMDQQDAFYVMRTSEGDFVGMCYIEDVELDKSRGKIGIWLDQDQRGKGYSQHRAEVLLVIAFDHLDLDVVEVEVVPDNTASVKSVIKYMDQLGGQFDGRRRNATKTPSGEIVDLYLWSISQSEFNAQESVYTEVEYPQI